MQEGAARINGLAAPSTGAFAREWTNPAQRGRAHKLARMVYFDFMLTRGEGFVDQRLEKYVGPQCKRSMAALKRRAASLGFAVTPTAAVA